METPQKVSAATPVYSPLAGMLSYLIPGLGQICQGRVAKGLLFLVALYGLFFYGMALGDWKNVWLPDTGGANQDGFSRAVNDLYNRPHFAGQFWIGVAAWPAVYQYWKYDETKETGPLFGSF